MNLRERLACVIAPQLDGWCFETPDCALTDDSHVLSTIVDAILDEIDAAGYDMIEHIPMTNPEAPILHQFTVTPDEDSFFIQFPGLPGCMTHAETLYEIGPMAQDAYVNWTQAARDGGYTVPEPKP